MRRERIDVRQLLCLVVLHTVGSSVLYVPSAAAYYSKQDGWLAVMIAVLLSAGAALLYGKWLGAVREKTIFDYIDNTVGKWLGSVLILLYAFVSFLDGVASLLSYLGSFMTTQIIPETPRIAVQAMFILAVVIGLRLGMKTVARAGELFAVIMTLTFVALTIFVFPQAKLDNILPVFEANGAAYIRTILHYLSFTTLTLFSFWTLYPQVDGHRKSKIRAFVIGHAIGGFFLFLMTFMCILVLGSESTARASFPSYMLAQKINLAEFITRIEVLMATLWLTTLYFKMSMYFYFGIKALEHVLQLKDGRSMIFPWAIICMVLSLILYPNTSYQIWWDTRIWPMLTIVLFLFLPLGLWMVSFLKSQMRELRE
ncbi:GerAB/ArcD/ProY family transporter [Paenibacillus apiarius]|uniref:GerAB/ArcD/ProY family transporter n=1 Tax=Paenibacillus apiarius TaxID=46240 RepID=UPI00197E8E8F|nr:endospore germination permease [Paenibacillus apiarius]MBN3523545.1 endospore germination permease [Paenibacillus apiarius]